MKDDSCAFGSLSDGYLAVGDSYNPWDVCTHFIFPNNTRDWGNSINALALASNPTVQVYFGGHSWKGWADFDWAKQLATFQQLPMEDLYARHGRDPYPGCPYYTNQQLSTYLGGVYFSLIQGDDSIRPTSPGGAWYELLHGGNENAWDLVLMPEIGTPEAVGCTYASGWPPYNPRAQGKGRTK